MGGDDQRGDDSGATQQSFGDPGKLRRPSVGEIRDAVDATPTVEEPGPGIPAPSYLDEEGGRVAGTVAKGDPLGVGDAPGFTDVPNDDPTHAPSGLATSIEDERPAARGNPERRGLLILAATVAIAVVALGAIVTMMQ